MNNELRIIKNTLRAWLRRYPADRLAALLAHAQEGRLAYRSCCCFIGVETADHALQEFVANERAAHFIKAQEIQGAFEAERAYASLGYSGPGVLKQNADIVRRKRIIPMIRAEFRRRDREAVILAAERSGEEVACR